MIELFAVDGTTVVGPRIFIECASAEQAQAKLAELQDAVHKLVVEGAALPAQQKCKFCTTQATKRVIHSEGMAYVPTCDAHEAKAKDAAARCTPDGSSDPSNIDAVRPIKADAPAGANAPYKIKKLNGKWCVVNNAGLVKARYPGDDDGYQQALKFQRALYVNVPGAAKRADKVKFTGKAKDRVPAPKD